MVRHLSFTGNHSIDAEVLAAAISTTNSSFFARSGWVRWLGLGERRRLNDRELRRDVARLRLFYQASGFLDVAVDTVVVRGDEDVSITFKITEGEPVRVRSFKVLGLDSLSNQERLLEDLPLTVGMPFNRNLLLAAGDTLQNRLRDRGYPTASVFLNRRDVDRAAHTADLELLVDPGRRAIIGAIRVEHASRVDTAFIRKLLVTQPGRRYRQSDLYSSQLNLYRSDLFRYATVSIDTSAFTIGDPVVPLVISVEEGRLHRARASAGYATNDCFRTSMGWTARNFLGSGQLFDVSAQVSKIGVGTPLGFGAENSAICSSLKEDSVGSERANYILSTSIRRPAFISPSNALTASLFAERRSEFLVYLREDVGASFTFTRETQRRTPVALTYRISVGRTLANAVSFCAFFNACRADDLAQLTSRRLQATLTGTLSRQRVNNLIDPTRGSITSFEVSHSSKFIGSSSFSQFTRFVADFSWYRPLGSDVVLATHVRGGVTVSPKVQLSENASNFVPPEQRFYAGGANDVRGYNRNELGPVVYVVPDTAVTRRPGEADSIQVREGAVSVAPTGGNTLLLGNVEFRLPSPVFSPRLRWAVFLDAGTVWERGTNSSAALRFTPGIGLRVATPLGPVRFDVAYNGYDQPRGALYEVETQTGDLKLLLDSYQRPTRRSPFTLQFSIGQAF